MKRIYIIKFNKGIDPDEDWTFAETEDEAKKIVDALNRQLSVDRNRVEYLLNHGDLIFGEHGKLNYSNDAKEYERLLFKYPMGWTNKKEDEYDCNFEFYYIELEKKVLSPNEGSFLFRDRY